MRKPSTTTTEKVAGDHVANLTPPDEQLPGMPPDPDPAPPRKRTDPRKRHDQPTGNAPGRPRAAAGPGKPSNHAKLARALTDQHVFAGAMISMWSPLTGRAMIEQAEQCGESLATWADSNKKVADLLNRMVDGAGAVGVLAAYAPIAMALYQDLAARDTAKLSTPAPRRTAPASSSRTAPDLHVAGDPDLAAYSNGEVSVDQVAAEVLFEPGFMAPNS